jgi:signal transduction histidine kinase
MVQDSAVAINLYRIAQEAANNAIKHGKATSIAISLSASHGTALLCIRDNGGGFSKGSGASKGLGLRVMQYRASRIGGSLTIDGDSKKGTTISCTFPFAGDVARQPHRSPRPTRSERLSA